MADKIGAKRRRPTMPVAGAHGMSMRITAIPGVTKGDAKAVLASPYVAQIAPMDAFSLPTSFGFGTFQDYNGNEHLSRGGSVLRDFSIKTVILEYATFAKQQNWDTDLLYDDLERLVEAGYPVRLQLQHPYNVHPEFQGPVVLVSMNRTEQAGEPDARYIDITFKEYDRDKIKTRGLGSSDSMRDFPFSLTVKKGQIYGLPSSVKRRVPKNRPSATWTLADLCKWVYGDSAYASAVAQDQLPPIKGFGFHTPLVKYAGYKKGGKITFAAFELQQALADEDVAVSNVDKSKKIKFK